MKDYTDTLKNDIVTEIMRFEEWDVVLNPNQQVNIR
jgi:hypothetical protein